MDSIRQIRLLVQKSFSVLFKTPETLCFQFLIPALLASLLQIGRYNVERDLSYVNKTTVWPSFPLEPMYIGYYEKDERLIVPYTAENRTPAIDFIMERLTEKLNKANPKKSLFGLFGKNTYPFIFESKYFSTEEELLNFTTRKVENAREVFLAVTFHNVTEKHLNYTIRPLATPRAELNGEKIQGQIGWMTNLLYPYRSDLKRKPMQSFINDPKYGNRPNYYKEGIASTQHFINMIWMGTFNQSFDESEISVTLQRFPYPPFVKDDFIIAIEQNLPFVLLLSFCYITQQVGKHIAIDKETRIKEYMLMMGLPRSILWSSYFLFFLLQFVVICILVTTALCTSFSANGAIINYSSPTVIFAFLLLYCVSLIGVGSLVSTFFDSSSSTSAACGIIIVLLYIPFGFIQNNIDGISQIVKLSLSVSPPVAMALGCSIISAWESSASGVNWNNLFHAVSIADSMSLAHIFAALILDTVLLLLVTYYIDQVRPGSWGISRPWWFPIQWLLPSQPVEKVEQPPNERAFVEPVPKDTEVGFMLSDVCKTFPAKRTGRRMALNKLSFVAPCNQVTVLLGKNGAGKSTTMNLLSGMLEPTSGRCLVGEHDIVTQTKKAREFLGLCPQFNILIKELTVRQHLELFGQIKGATLASVQLEIETLVDEIQLREKIDTRAGNLSGGMQRKLSLGIAIVGGSKFIILDEPSSGVDVRARTELWDIMSKYGRERTLLVSTHYMDEAEAIGHRIVMINEGELTCDGTISFIKNKFNEGYYLNVSLHTAATDIDKFLQRRGLARLHTDDDSLEREYRIPPNFEEMANFLEDFEARIDELKIEAFGLSIMTMEEIFLKLSKGDIEKEGKNKSDDENQPIDDEWINWKKPVKLETGKALVKGQFLGAFHKCRLYATRNRKIILMQLLTPAVLLLLSLIQIQVIPEIGGSPKLDLSMLPYVANGHSLKTPVQNLEDELSSILEPSETIAVKNLTKWIPNELKKMRVEFNNRYIIGLGKNSSRYTGFFNAQAYHAAGTAVLYADKIIASQVLPGSTIETSIFPLPKHMSTPAEKKRINVSMQGAIIVFNTTFGIMIMFAAFAMLPVKERKVGVATLQRTSGASIYTLWLAQYCWDILNTLPSFLLLYSMFLTMKNLTSIQYLLDYSGALSCLSFMFILVQLPFVYCLSFLFTEPASALSYISSINLVLSMAPFITTIILRVPSFGLMQTSWLLNKIFLILPQYNFAQGVFDLYYNSNVLQFCTKSIKNEGLCETTGIKFNRNIYSLDDIGIGRYLLAMFLQWIVSLTVLFSIEYFRANHTLQTCFKSQKTCSADVPKNNEYPLLPIRAAKPPLTIQNLHKLYKNFTAVFDISFDVQFGECVALLGPNGAGKTTTFKMITGEVPITGGTAAISGFDVGKNRLEAQRQFGYCPQFDALLDVLTGREHLQLYSRLRGIPESEIEEASKILLRLLGIEQYADQKVVGYSGGTKRKLSVAIAMIGGPPLLILDEPSCGLDPSARHKLWSVIKRAKSANIAILLTSHSMEECTALCDKLAIIVAGKLKAIGTQQKLKSQFSNAVEVTLHFDLEKFNFYDIKILLRNCFKPLCQIEIKQHGMNTIRCSCPKNVKLFSLFIVLEKLKKEGKITGFTVSQATLEQIFMQLTRNS